MNLSRRLSTYIWPFWPVLAFGILANIFYSGTDAFFTYLLKPFMNKGFIDRDDQFLQYVPLIILVGITFRGIVSSVGGYCMTWVARNVVKVFRQQVFRHVLSLPAKYYDKTSSGQLLSKLLYDVEQISQVGAEALTTLVQSICLVIGLLVVMFIISWQLSLFFLGTVPFIALIVRYTNKRIRRVSHKVQESMGEVTDIAEESIEGYKVVRIFGGQDYEIKKFERATELSRQRDMKVAITKAYNICGVQIVIALGIASIIFVAIKLSSVILITAGGFLSIIAAMLQLIKPMKNLTTVTSVIQRGLAGAESIFNLLDVELEKDTGTGVLHKVQGRIGFHDVSFAYYPDSEPVLKQINFTIQPGQTVALVGRSGSGKTTLASLLPRFYDINQGMISIDDVDIQQLTLANLRQHIALVNQQVTLFNDTVANNIAYGYMGDVTEEQIIQAANAAHAMEFVEQFPQGIHTLVGENGVLLSGGQRQRLAIARAILKDSPILILDEATSALDTESERLIQAALEEVMRNRTTLVIAHRLSTIENADLIMVIDEGQIVEVGNHQQLLAKSGHYANLYHMQFKEHPPQLPEDVVKLA